MGFLIDRGHCGPARVGKFKTPKCQISIPSLIGPSEVPDVIKYHVFERSNESPKDCEITSFPSLISTSEFKFEGMGDSLLLLMPSLVGSSSLGQDGGQLLLEQQLHLLTEARNEFDRSNAVIRVPSNIDPNWFKDIIEKFNELDVCAASFIFTGKLDQDTLRNIALRSQLPTNWLAIALGRIKIFAVPILYYFGFDLFDLSYAYESSTLRQRLWRMSTETITDSEPRHCMCDSCTAQGPLVELEHDGLTRVLENHNVALYREIVSECVHTLHSGNLRWLVESMTHSSPGMSALFRKANKQFYEFLEEFTPTSGASRLPLIGPESYHAPVIRRFRHRIKNRYSPPIGKKVLLLLPCSAKKPYSESRSHKLFNRYIRQGLGSSRSEIAEIILTSPLGVVPRELERVYPASQYDIPVTGEWDSEEITIAAEALTSCLSKFDESAVVVAHLAEGYLDVAKDAESRIRQSIIYTSTEGLATSTNSLESLQEVLNDLKNILSLEQNKPTLVKESLRATADYQFGEGASKVLLPDSTTYAGKIFRSVVCRYENQQTCTFVADNGFLSLTLTGGRMLSSMGQYWVRFEGKRMKGGSIFAVGVQDADENIRPGDEVIVINNENEVIAVGRSEMSGREMCQFSNGRAVSVRHQLE